MSNVAIIQQIQSKFITNKDIYSDLRVRKVCNVIVFREKYLKRLES